MCIRDSESRYKGNETFKLLIKELEAQRTARAQSQVSLVESVRKQERADRSEGREQREELYRKAFGVGGSDDDDDEEVVPDIILEEAANVLSDIMDSAR